MFHIATTRDRICRLICYSVISKDSRIVNTLEKHVKEKSVFCSCQWSRSKLCLSSVSNHRLLPGFSGFSPYLLSHPLPEEILMKSHIVMVYYAFFSACNYMKSCMDTNKKYFGFSIWNMYCWKTFHLFIYKKFLFDLCCLLIVVL